MSSTISLNCWILGDDPNELFVVTVPSSEPVVYLKRAIKQAYRKALKNVDEKNLMFYKTSIFIDDTFMDKVAEITANADPIHPLTRISDVFPPVLDKQCVHLIVCLASRARRPIRLPPVTAESEVAGRRLRFLNACKSHAHFSQGKPRTFLRDQQNQSETILCNPPCITSHIIPPTLLHPVFGQFIDDCEIHQPKTEDNQLVLDLSKAMSDIDRVEQERRGKIIQVFAKHGIELNSTRIMGTNIMTDGDISYCHLRYAIAVLKQDIGSTGAEPYLQGGLYHLESSRNVAVELSNSVIPCILILICGSYIGFAGSAWTDRPNVQTLSTTIPMHCHPTDTATRYAAARHIGALRAAIHSLNIYYRDELQARATPLTSLTSPHNPKFPYPSCFKALDNSTKKTFTYTSHPMDDKLVFFGKLLDDGDDICIKFVREYSPDAHAFCASKGFAPALRGFERLPGGWYMVIMDRIPGDYVNLGDFLRFTNDTCIWKALSDDIRRHLHKMHCANFVHGDLRDTNIMVKQTAAGFSVFLVDFNWSGEHGVVRYPANINTQNIWRPKGARDGEFITAEHDLAMVGYIVPMLFHLPS